MGRARSCFDDAPPKRSSPPRNGKSWPATTIQPWSGSRAVVLDWCHGFYNHNRRHSTIGMLSPSTTKPPPSTEKRPKKPSTTLGEPQRTLPTPPCTPHETPTHDSGPSRIATPYDARLFHPHLHTGLSRRFPNPHDHARVIAGRTGDWSVRPAPLRPAARIRSRAHPPDADARSRASRWCRRAGSRPD